MGLMNMARHAEPEQRMLAVLTLVSGLVMTTGIWLSAVPRATSSPPAIVLGDASEAHIVEIRDSSGATVLSGEFRSRVDALGNIEKDAALTNSSGSTVIGEVEVEVPASGRTDRRPELEVDIMGLPARQVFWVVIDDRVVATFSTDDRGSVDMELQEGEVPPQSERTSR
jgi:hypothetical protein